MADYSTFEHLNVQVLAISHNTIFSQKMFAASLELPYPLLSDHPDMTVIQRYDVLTYIGNAHQPVALGAYFLIDKHGIVRGKWIKKPGEVFPNAPLLQAAQDLGP